MYIENDCGVNFVFHLFSACCHNCLSQVFIFSFRNPFVTDFGGVVGLTAAQMETTNGYSNFYWGWGAEDDDIKARLGFRGYNVSRSHQGFYRHLPHKKAQGTDICYERYVIWDETGAAPGCLLMEGKLPRNCHRQPRKSRKSWKSWWAGGGGEQGERLRHILKSEKMCRKS